MPEVIEDGVTGFVRDTEDELVDVLGRITELDRTRCRAEAEHRFSPAAMADAYEWVYAKIIASDTPEATRLRRFANAG